MSEVEDVIGGNAEESTATTTTQPAAATDGGDEVMQVEAAETEKMVTETIDEDGDVVEETTEVTRKTVKRTMKITETSSTTKTTTMTTPAKLYGKDLSEYDEVDVDALLAQLSPEEINILAKEVDPDDNFLPPDQRCSYECEKNPTGPLDRKKLIQHINKQAVEEPDQPEFEPFVKGTVRGKKWVPPPRDARELEAEEQIAIDMGEEYEHALSDATQEEIIDLAAILGFHSMMNQDQYHASLLNKGQPVGLGWDGITKSTQQKIYPADPPNNTDVDESIKRVKEDDAKLIELNLNNIKNISDEKFEQLFEALPQNEHLEVLSLTNVGLTDKTALLLAEAIEKSKTLRVLNVETNFISPPVIVNLVKALLNCRTVEEFRASNQRSSVLGNKIEMEITDLVEKNSSLLRLGLHLEFNDARHRVAAHLQRNIDRNEIQAKTSSHHSIERMTSLQASLKHSINPKDASSSLPSAVLKHVIDANDSVTYLNFGKKESATEVANNVTTTAKIAVVDKENDVNRVNKHVVVSEDNKPIATVVTAQNFAEPKQPSVISQMTTAVPSTPVRSVDSALSSPTQIEKITEAEKNFRNSNFVIGAEALSDVKDIDTNFKNMTTEVADKYSTAANDNYLKLKNISTDVSMEEKHQNGNHDNFKNITIACVAKESKELSDNADKLNNNATKIVTQESNLAKVIDESSKKITQQVVNESKDIKSNVDCLQNKSLEVAVEASESGNVIVEILKNKHSEAVAETKSVNDNEGKFKKVASVDVAEEIKAKNFKNTTDIVAKESKLLENNDNNKLINNTSKEVVEKNTIDDYVIRKNFENISTEIVAEEPKAKMLNNINSRAVTHSLEGSSKNISSDVLVPSESGNQIGSDDNSKNISTENVTTELKSVHIEENLRKNTSEVVAEKEKVVNSNDDALQKLSSEIVDDPSKDNGSNNEDSRNIGSEVVVEDLKVVTKESEILSTNDDHVINISTEKIVDLSSEVLAQAEALTVAPSALKDVEKITDYKQNFQNNSLTTVADNQSTPLSAVISTPEEAITASVADANVMKANSEVFLSSLAGAVAKASADLPLTTSAPITPISMAKPLSVAQSQLSFDKFKTPSSSLASSHQNLSSLQSQLAHDFAQQNPSQETLSTSFKHTVKIVDADPNLKNYNVEVVVANGAAEVDAEPNKIIRENITATTITPSTHTINKSFCIDGYQMKLVLKIVRTVNDPKAPLQSKATTSSTAESSPLTTTATIADPAAAPPAALNIIQNNAAAAAEQRDEKEI